jgi:hypothetical protein
MSSPGAAPYEALVGLIEHELELAREARYGELADAAQLRAEFVGTLPDAPSAEAREPLQRALRLHQLLVSEALRGRDSLVEDAAHIERATRTARGYAPPRLREHLSASA